MPVERRSGNVADVVGMRLPEALAVLERSGLRVRVDWTAPPRVVGPAGGGEGQAPDSVQPVPRAARVVRQRPARAGEASGLDVELVAAIAPDGLRRGV